MKKKEKTVRKPLTRGAAKVPVVMQMEQLECGAASLTMILAYYGKWLPLEQVRADCGVSRDGASAKNVLKAARRYGLDASGYRYEPEELVKCGTFPCIIHWNFNHFVVLNGFRHGKAVINDPAKGTYSVPMKVFDASFTGICMLFEPTENFVPGGKPKSVLDFVKKKMDGAGTAAAFTLITTVLASVFGLITPAFSRIFIDRLLTGKNPDWIPMFTLALAACSFLQITVSFILHIYSARIDAKLTAVGSAAFLWKLLHMPMEFYPQRSAGDLQMRQGLNASVSGKIVNTFTPLVINAAMTVFYLIVMLRYSVLLSAVGLLSIVLNTVVSRVISDQRTNHARIRMRDDGKLAGAASAGVEMIETIKASGAENGFFERWAGYQANVNVQSVRFSRVNRYLGMIPQLISMLTNTAVLILGVWLVMEGTFTVGMVMAFQGFLGSFLSPALRLVSAGHTYREMRSEMERIEDVMEYPTAPVFAENNADAEVEYSKLTGAISMKNVTFGYSALAEPVIRDFHLELKPGSRVALVGASGCGKSTVSKLLSGLYQPWSGEILFDGKPMSEIDRNVFTGSLAVVDQDIILFEDTFANNIKMWDSSIEDYEMILAARDAQLHEDIMRRDGGYGYRLTEGGKDLSGGQRQRLEIARVLAQDPTVIILDEATSALDARTELDVMQAIRDRGITCIVVAHRLSTVRDCDEILVMNRGTVVERGTHEQLYAQGGFYTKLVTND